MQRLLIGAADERLGAVVALLFLQGWRVSEALGLAWEDINFEDGTADVRRACIYVDHQGARLGPPKTEGALGRHLLLPDTVALLQKRRIACAEERVAAGPRWETQRWMGRPIELCFPTTSGGLSLRQTVTKTLATAAKRGGLDSAGISTHTGRRSLITALYADGNAPLDDIARFVGHATPSTTAGYVRALGRRPAEFADRVQDLLDTRRTTTNDSAKRAGETN